MNKPDITSACLHSTLQFPFQLQHVSYKSAQGYAARIILLKTTLRNTVLVHITKLVLTMRFWLSAAFSVVLMVHEANGAKITNTSTPVRTNRNGETIVCNQYIGQGVETSEAIKKLDEKLDQLIKLLQPPAFSGKMHSIIASNFHDFIYESLHFLCDTSQFSNKCKEIAGKSNHDDFGNKNIKSNWFYEQTNCSARASHFLVSFYRRPRLQDNKEKKP